ncbi:hypothetical protein PYCC9005_001944 [Savitreella phatthalungensis]
MSTAAAVQYPPARRDDSVVDTYPRGVKVADPYRWLEKPEDKETEDFVDGQNAVFRKYISAFPESDKAALRKAAEQAHVFPKFSAPRKRGTGEHVYYYWSYNPGSLNQSQIWRSRTLDRANAELFFDPNLLSDDGTVSLSTTQFTKDGSLFAYSLSVGGSDHQTVYVKETHKADTDQRLKDEVKYVKFSSIAWLKDNSGFVYHRYPDKDTSGKGTAQDVDAMLCFHKLGSPQSDDVVIYNDPQNPSHMFGFEVSEDGNYGILTTSEGTAHKNKLAILQLPANGDDLADAVKQRTIIRDTFESAFDYINNYGTRFIFTTDDKGASRTKIVTLELAADADAKHEFVDLVPESELVLDSVVPVRSDKLVLTYTKDVQQQVFIYDASSGKQIEQLDLPTGLAVYYVSCAPDGDELCVVVGGFTSPLIVYHYDFDTSKLELYRQTSIDGFDATDYETEQVFYESKDGTRVPMFVTGRKALTKGDPTPCLLYGYGGFQIPVSPSYSALFAVLMRDFGARIAVANIRGGGEYGVSWWEAAIKERRQTAFDDFQYAAKYLASNSYTTPEKLAIYGGSNGGLLVATCLNQAPELYGAVMATVGVLDMLRFNKFTIGAAWESDYGCPEDPKMFPILYGYSPLHNVRIGREESPKDLRYPPVLLTTADRDDRVVPAHTLKFAAEVQYRASIERETRSAVSGPFLCRVDVKAGHGAGKPTSKQIDETFDRLVFLSLALNIKFEPATRKQQQQQTPNL